MNASVTHIAGPVVAFRKSGRVIQRCALCGEKLLDNLNVMVPCNPDGSPGAFCTWGEARLIQVDGNRSSDVGDFRDGPVPDDFCLALVE